MGYRILAGLGRIAISLVFVVLGVSAMFHWDMAKGDLTTALGNWEMYAGHIDGASVVFQYLSAAVPVLVALGIAFQIAGGILVGLSLRVRMGACIMFLQIVCATLIYYPFWFLDEPAMARTLVLFLKNLSIIGGLLVIMATGSGVTIGNSSKGKTS